MPGDVGVAPEDTLACASCSYGSRAQAKREPLLSFLSWSAGLSRSMVPQTG